MRSTSLIVFCGLSVLVPLRCSASDEPAADRGSVTGQFILEGDIPELKPLVLKDDPLVRDSANCAARTIFDESLLVSPKSKGIANIFVWLRRVPEGAGVPPRPNNEVTTRFDGCRFTPHNLIARAGQTIRWQQGDRCLHLPQDYPLKNDRGCIGFADIKDYSQSYELAEPLPVTVRCGIHLWETAYWLVVDHPFAAITKADGQFRIENLPVGTHIVSSWHERCGWVERTIGVKVEAGKETRIEPYKVPVAKLQKAK